MKGKILPMPSLRFALIGLVDQALPSSPQKKSQNLFTTMHARNSHYPSTSPTPTIYMLRYANLRRLHQCFPILARKCFRMNYLSVRKWAQGRRYRGIYTTDLITISVLIPYPFIQLSIFGFAPDRGKLFDTPIALSEDKILAGFSWYQKGWMVPITWGDIKKIQILHS